nr:MAG TPA: hypothetical protein [Caudoviricetes sp.]DAZ68207.1 MAG TPA: hypothetical protein [Caudoviricetes sp.]
MYIGEKLIFYQIMLESNAILIAFCYNLRKIKKREYDEL